MRPVGKGAGPANVSERLSRRTLGLTTGAMNWSESFDIDEMDLLSIREGREAEISELRVVELGVDGLREGEDCSYEL